MIAGTMIKPCAVLIEVRINRLPEGKLCGAAICDSYAQVAANNTLEPGSVNHFNLAVPLRQKPGGASDEVIQRSPGGSFPGNKSVWNRNAWIKDPATGRRRHTLRPMTEWVIIDSPQLKIVGDERWSACEAIRKIVGGEVRLIPKTVRGPPNWRSRFFCSVKQRSNRPPQPNQNKGLHDALHDA